MTATTRDISLKDKLLAEFELQKTALLLENPLLDNFRSGAAKTFSESGFPTKKDEDYKYLRFDRLEKADLSVPLTSEEQAVKSPVSMQAAPDDAIHISLINGFPELSGASELNHQNGIEIIRLSDAIRSNNKHVISLLGTLVKSNADPFAALNSALFMDGIFIHLKKDFQCDKPIFITEINESAEGSFAQSRILVLAERHSSARIYHYQTNPESCKAAFSNTVIEAELEAGAKIDWICIQDEVPEALHVLGSGVHIYSGAVFSHVMVSLGGGLIRNNTALIMEESGAEGHLFGYYHPKGAETIDNHTVVDHRTPHCNSNELYKGVVDGKGTAVFNGKIFVQKDAQKTNAFQSNKNILLSEGASVNTKPQLEIYADDVKCSHGSSTGVLDPDQLFYLRARGISLKSARKLLLSAYAGEVIGEIPDEHVREYLNNRIEQLIEHS